MPRDRPRWAMLTSPATKSGTSRTRVANSSIISTSRGIGGSRGSRRRSRAVLRQVLGLDPGQHLLPAAQLGGQRLQRPQHGRGVQVGDHAEHVRQPDAGLERAAALVVDQHEGQLVRPVDRGQRRHHRLQQFGLARPGGAGDQPVRAVLDQVQRGRRPRSPGRSGSGWRRGVAARPGRRSSGSAGRGVQQVQQPDLVRQPAGLLRGDVAQRRQRPGDLLAPRRGDQVRAYAGQVRQVGVAEGQPARPGQRPRRRTPPAAAAPRCPGRPRTPGPPGPR